MKTDYFAAPRAQPIATVSAQQGALVPAFLPSQQHPTHPLLAHVSLSLPLAMSCSDGGTGPDVSGSDPDVDIRSAEAQKKRRGNPQLWGRNVAKAKRDSGQEYVSDKTKNVVAARVVGPPCTCPRRCYDRVGADNVKCIFHGYWKIGDHNAQSSYLMNRVVSKEVSRRYAGPSTKRNVTYEYSVLVDNNKVLVCKVAFCNIHSISMKRVDNVTKKAGKTGVAPVDQRGSASSANKTPDDVLQVLHDHIFIVIEKVT